MKFFPFFLATAITVTPIFAEETRQLFAHEHGVGQLDIAIDGKHVAMGLHAPGADIVGFEYAAESAEDLAIIEAAVAKLLAPLDLFLIPEAAGCSIVKASAGLESNEEHEEHDEDHADKEHAHDEHAKEEREENGHDDDEYAQESGHTEFYAEYFLNCSEPTELTGIDFAYFEIFPNSLEVEVQIITETGATSFEIKRDDPTFVLNKSF